MNVPAAGTIKPGDRALRVDMEGDGEIGARWVNGSEATRAQQKTVKSAVAVNIGTHDIAPRVDPIRDRKQSSWHVDLGELVRLARVTSCLHCR